MDKIGAWVNLNKEAIYASKPWEIYGDNLYSYLKREDGNADITNLEALKERNQREQFNERTIKSEPYGHDEVRFTTNGATLYMFVLNPEEGEIKIPSLGLTSPYNPNVIKSIQLIGGKNKIRFEQNKESLTLFIPRIRPNKYTAVFVVEGAL